SHGSRSSQFRPRNNYVADILKQHAIATILADLLTKAEDMEYENRFNIKLLSKRLVAVTGWAFRQKELMELPAGYFGASTGAASALFASVNLKNKIHAVVSRGGRPDLVMDILEEVEAPS